MTWSSSRAASRALGTPENVYAGAITAWEIAINAKSGKLSLASAPHEWFRLTMERYQITEIPLQTDLLCAAADLLLIHRDPFDRVLVAVALDRHLVILTPDRIIPTYPAVRVLW